MTRNYIHFKETYQFVQGNISSFNEIYSFREIISIQGNMLIEGTYIRSSSRPYVHSRKRTIFIEHCCIHGIKQKYLYKNCPQPLYDNFYKLYNYYHLNKV